MLGKPIKKLLLTLPVLTSLSCTSIPVPDTQICAVAGYMSQGADCSTMVTGTETSMNLDEFIKFLEPEDKPGQEKPAAICMPALHWTALKTAFEQACAKLRGACRKAEVEFKKADRAVTTLLEKSRKKRKRGDR